MRATLPLIALLCATAASADAPPSTRSAAAPQPLWVVPPSGATIGRPVFERGPAMQIDGAAPTAPMFQPIINHPADGSPVCRDRIEQVRAASGQPRLDRDNTAGDEPLLIAAVDKRIGGCSVMVMRNNLSDVRPIPPAEGTGRLRPIR